MLILKYILTILFLIACPLCNTTAQPPDNQKGHESVVRMITALKNLDNSVFSREKDLINGKIYYSAGNNFVHPFFSDNTWKPATIYTESNIYNVNNVKYDLLLDYLVLLYTDDSLTYPVYLNREIAGKFDIYDHHFEYLDDFSNKGIKELLPGYYEIAYGGKTTFLIRRIKVKTYDTSGMDGIYSDRIYFFVKKGGNYARLKRKKDLYNLLDDHRKEIKTFLNTNNIRFSGDDYGQTVKVLEYYDSLH
jgi:hypothetical protein